MQSDDLAVLCSFLRSVKEIDKLSSSSLERWPTYAATLSKCSETDGAVAYQSQKLKGFSEAKRYFESMYKVYCTKVSNCLKSRLSWSNLQMLRDIILVLATQGWEKLVDEDDTLDTIDRLVEHFSYPLTKAGICIEKIHSEFESMLKYGCQYFALSTLEFLVVWWRLFNAPVASEWLNALTLVELLFSLPSSNGIVERVFSQMKVIKTKKRSLLSNEALDDLLAITSKPVPLKEFSPDAAIDLWWKEKVCRPNQKPRKKCKRTKHTKSTPTASTSNVASISTAASSSNAETLCIEILSSDSELEVQSNSSSDSEVESINLLDEWDDWMELGSGESDDIIVDP